MKNENTYGAAEAFMFVALSFSPNVDEKVDDVGELVVVRRR